MDIRASMRRDGAGRWTATLTDRPEVRASAGTPERCLTGLRRAVDKAGLLRSTRAGAPALLVEVTPPLAGVAEAAEIIGWDKRRVVTYIDRGRFPEPVQTLASGRVWNRSDIEAYAAEWHARRASRRRGARPAARRSPAKRVSAR